MSILLVRTEQNYLMKGVMSAAPMYETYAFAIDLGNDIAIKRRLWCGQVLKAVNDFAKDHPDLMMEIDYRDIPYDGGAIHLINFFSPLLDLDDIPKYQETIKVPLRDFNPVLINEDTLQKISNLDNHEFKDHLPAIENEIFRVQRERKLLLNTCDTTPKNDQPKPQTKL